MSVSSRKGAAATSTTPPKTTIKTSLWALAVKWLALAAMLAVATTVIIRLAGQQSWIGVIIVSAMAMGGLIVYASHRAVPAKYLYPGLLLLLALQVWPTVYTIGLAFTNYGDGHIVSKQESINQITSNSVVEVPGSPRYRLTVAVVSGQDPATGAIHFLLVNPTDNSLSVGTSKGLKPLSGSGVQFYPDGRIKSAPGYTTLTPKQVNARSKELQSFAVPDPTRRGNQVGGPVGGVQGDADDHL